MVPDQADLADCVRLLRNIAWETDESQVRALLRWSILVANRPASPTTTAASDEWGGAAVLLRSSVPILDMWAQAAVPERRAADTVWYVLQRLLAPEHHLHGRPPLPRELTDSLLGEAARRSVVRCLEECPYVEDAERVAATPPEALVCPLCLAAYCGALDVVSVLVTVANSSSTARPPAAVPLHEPPILFPLGRDVCVHIATAASVARSEECMSTLADCWRRAAVAQHHNNQQTQQKPDWDWNSSTAPHFLPFSMSPFAVPSLHIIAVMLSSLFQQQRPLLEQEESVGRFLALQEEVLHRLSRLLRSVSDVEESLQLADAILHTPLWSAADSYGGGTLIHLLVCCSMTAALRGLLAWLVEHWVTSSSVNSGGLHSPPLTTAVLLNSLSRRNRHRETPLSTAIAHGDEGAVRLLLLHGASAHQPCVVQGKTMLVAPIEAARSSTTVQRLLCAIPTTQATPLSSSRSWIADTPAFEPWHRSNPPPSTTTSSSSSSSSDEGSPRLNQCLATALSASSLATMFCSISERLRLAAQTQYDSNGLPSSSSPVHPKKVDAIARMLLCALQADPWHTASLEAFRTLLLKHAPALVGLQREVHRYLDDSAREPTISLPHSNHKRLPLPRESAVKGGDEPAQRSNHVMLAGCGKAMTHVRVFLDHELRSSVWVALLSPVDLQEGHKHMQQSDEAVHGVVAGPTSPCSIVHSFDLVVFRRFSRRHNFAKGEGRLQEVSDDEDGNEVVYVAERVLREGGHRLPLCLSSSYPVRHSAVYRRCVIGCRSERQKSRVDPTGWMTQLHHNTSTTTKQGGVLEDLPTSLSLWTAAWQEPIRRRRVGLSLWAIEVDDWLTSSEATTYPGCVGCIVTTDLCRIQEELLRDDPMGTVWAHCTLIVDRESSLVVAIGRRHGR